MNKIIFSYALLMLLFILPPKLFGQQSSRLVDYVNPFIGTAGHGHTYPGAVVPFGLVQLSPDNPTAGWDWCSGYNYSDSIIVGFSHTHLSGTGIGDLCDILFMPTVLPDEIESNNLIDYKFQSHFNHENESASPGYYSVLLEDYNIKVELTATKRTGIHRYTFPQGSKSAVVVDLGYSKNWDSPTEGSIKILDNSTIAGYRYSTGWAKDQRVYFYAKFSKMFDDYSFITADTNLIKASAANHKKVKGISRFNTNEDEIITVKVGISPISIDGAKRNYEAEAALLSFDEIRGNAAKEWEKHLSQIVIQSADENLKTIFYTAMYHAMLAPTLFSDIDGSYRGADGKIHKADGYNKYTIFSLWDTFRAWHPLTTIILPERVNDFINSMLSFYREYGLLPDWELWGNETNTMIGYHAIPVLADAILKGFSGFDIKEAFEAMKKSAMQDSRGIKYYKQYGYVPFDKEPESVSKTLEYAYDDWCIAQAAKFMSLEDDYIYFMERSSFYKNIFDSSINFMRGKDSEGNWREPFNALYSEHRKEDYTEGNAWQYTWFVPHDIAGLINLFGGNEKFIEKLDSLFILDSVIEGVKVSPDISGLIGQYAHGNEPGHHIPYLYNFAGQPWKTQQKVSEILKTLYNYTPDGLCGNEDCGQMSAWYIFSSLGFYPVNPSNQVYVLGSPLFEKAEIAIDNERKFIITAKDVSKKNIYIQSVRLNDKPLERSYLFHDEIINGGRLEFLMGDKPNKNWGSKPEELPPSGK
jgi:predicted alpha-1,2-mannosidase